MRALALAHEMIAESGWGGMSLETLLRAEHEPYRDQTDAEWHLEGPDINLPVQVVQPLVLAVHELATNDAKYGAFKGAEGRLMLPGHDDPMAIWRFSGGSQEFRVCRFRQPAASVRVYLRRFWNCSLERTSSWIFRRTASKCRSFFRVRDFEVVTFPPRSGPLRTGIFHF
jgi:hypothetical protein